MTAFVLFGTDAPARQREDGPATRELELVEHSHELTIVGPGSLEAGNTVEISFARSLTGTLAELARVGTRVDAGDPLAALRSEPFERALEEARFALERAETSLQNTRISHLENEAKARSDLQGAESRQLLAEREAAQAAEELRLAESLYELGNESSDTVRAARDADADARAELQDARSALEDLRSSTELKQDIEAGELRDAELSVKQAELDVADAESDLEELTAAAPFAGVVAAVEAVVGSNISQNQVLLTLIDDSELQLDVQIDETEINSVREDQPVRLSFEAFPDETFAGTVRTIAPVGRIESNIPIFDVTVVLPNPDGTLRPGMVAEAEIITQEFPAAVTVPTDALKTVDGGSTLEVNTPSGEHENIPVEIIDSLGFNTVVTGEFPEGARIIVEDDGNPGGGAPRRGAGGGMPAVSPGMRF